MSYVDGFVLAVPKANLEAMIYGGFKPFVEL